MEEAKPEQSAMPPAARRKPRLWQWLAVALLLLTSLALMVTLILGWNEPQYLDRPLSHWLAELNGTNYIQREFAADALAKIGEPSIGPLVQALHKERSFIFELREMVRKAAPASIQKRIPKPWPADVLQFNACIGLAALGPKAQSVAPDLVLMLTNASPAIVSRATFALNRMGTNAHPALFAGLKSADSKLKEQCHTILRQSGVPVADLPAPKHPPAPEMHLDEFLNEPRVSLDEIKRVLTLLNPVSDQAIAALTPRLTKGSTRQRIRAALLLANLDVSSEPVTRTMMERLETLPEPERIACASGLRMQGRFLEPYTERIEKLADDPSALVALQVVLLLDQEFGDGQPKWKLTDRILAGNSEEEWLLLFPLLYGTVRTGLEPEKAGACLKRMLKNPNERINSSALDLIDLNPRAYQAIQADVEGLQTGSAAGSKSAKLKQHVERTLQAMKPASKP